MYHVIICDDEKIFIKYIKSIILQTGLSPETVFFHEYSSGEDFLLDMKHIQYCDLLILDMQMKKLNGHKTAKAFREKFPNAILVYCSGVYKPTDESFLALPFRYLLKDYSDSRMKSEIAEIINKMKNESKTPTITGRYYYNYIQLKPSDLLYIENSKHGSILHLHPQFSKIDFENKLTTDIKLRELYKTLKFHGYEFAHNSYLVNLCYVSKMLSSGEIELIDGTILTVSRSKLKNFRSSFAHILANKY